MSEYKTLKGLLGDATRSSGLKLALKAYPSDVWFEPLFRPTYKGNHTSEYWHGVNSLGEYQRVSELVPVKEWHPPKKKVTKYFWVDNKTGKIFDSMYATTDCNFHGKLTRLDWSATEFDDEN